MCCIRLDRSALVLLLLLLLVLVLDSAPPRTASAADWPQILGPERNGHAVGERVAAWPASGPPLIWSHKVGSGYAGPVVAEGKLVVFHRTDDKERLDARDATSGKPLWQAEFPASYGGGIDSDSGPRATPTSSGGKVFAFGAAGDFYCVSLAEGKKVWTRALYVDYKADDGYFGAGCSPLVVGDKVLVNVGGKDAGIVALDVATGKTAWQATDDNASYSSPTLATFGGKTLAIFLTRQNVVAVDPATGAVMFKFPFGKRGPTVNAATPLVSGGELFVTSSYGLGGLLARCEAEKATEVWANDESLSSQYNTPVLHGGYLYGIHGREDAGVAALRCVEFATGKVLWSEAEFGVAHLILAGDNLLVLKNNGELSLAPASPVGYKPIAKAQVSKQLTRSLPALAHGRLYIRDLAGPSGSVHCFAVGKEVPAGN